MKSALSIISLIIFIPLLCAANQDEDETYPSDPEIVLPSVILEIDDVSIESIDAALPAESELLPPEREVPLPAAEVMEAGEPVPDTGITDTENETPAQTEASLISEVILGAGSENNISSDISFFKLGASPRFTLFFSHEMLDGFGFRQASTGYNIREDSLEASIKGQLGPVDTEVSGTYYEIERGLQETGDYYSHLRRFIESKALFSIKSFDIWKSYTDIESSFTTMSLSGVPAPALEADYPPLETLAGIALGSELEFDPGLWGISAQYKYRNLTGNPDYELHRLSANTYFTLELPCTFTINGNLGYFYSTSGLWFIPFDLTIAANPVDNFSFHAAGGFRVVEHNLVSLWKEFEYMELPAGLPDNHGYFGESGIKLNFGNTFILSLILGLSADSVSLDYGSTVNPDTGLFTLSVSDDVLTGSGELGLRINVSNWMYIDLKTTGFIFSDPGIRPRLDMLIEGMMTDEQGKFGGNFSFMSNSNFNDPLQLPVFDMSLFFRISDNIRIIGEGYDLLYPLLQEERYSHAPYITPGIRGALKMHINF